MSWVVLLLAEIMILLFVAFRVKEKKTRPLFLLGASYLLQLISTCFSIAYFYTIFPPSYQDHNIHLMVVDAFKEYCHKCGSLLLMFYTTHSIFSFIDSVKLQVYEKYFHVVSFLLMVGLNGAVFFEFYLNADVVMDLKLFALYLSWIKLTFWWNVVVYIWSLVPPIIIAHRITDIVGPSSTVDRIRHIHRANPWFFVVLVIQTFLLAMSYVFNSIAQTPLPGSDRSILAFYAFGSLARGLFSVCHCLLLESIKRLFSNIAELNKIRGLVTTIDTGPPIASTAVSGTRSSRCQPETASLP
ncbi:hypothetical protein HDU91_005547 [Kappamyces sp. JEL0680]|nr:hypothetical protein HDU91_005547 [Kappamyces sp. JEL0680]